MPTLVEKIAKVAASVPQLAKKGDNGEYRYLTALDIFEAIRVKLFEAGILIIPQAQKSERSNPYLNITGDITDEWKTEITYRITDDFESIDCCAHGVGQDHEGKALYMASTGAKKDLLKTIFLLAGYEDDAESVTDTAPVAADLSQKIVDMEARCGPDVREWFIGRIEVNAWMSACRIARKSQREQKDYLAQFDVEKISDLKRKHFDEAMKWATQSNSGENE